MNKEPKYFGDKDAVWKEYPDVFIEEIPINDNASISVLKGGFGKPNPNTYMNNAVNLFVGNQLHNVFVESHLDTPWVKIVVFGINDFGLENAKNSRKKVISYCVTEEDGREHKFKTFKKALQYVNENVTDGDVEIKKNIKYIEEKNDKL